MRDRLLVHRLGQRQATVSETEINRIVELKGQILDRMSQLDFNPFWAQRRNTLIRDYLRPPRGGEFKISVLEAKLQELFGENATRSSIYYELVRAREYFHIDGPFRGPRGWENDQTQASESKGEPLSPEKRGFNKWWATKVSSSFLTPSPSSKAAVWFQFPDLPQLSDVSGLKTLTCAASWWQNIQGKYPWLNVYT